MYRLLLHRTRELALTGASLTDEQVRSGMSLPGTAQLTEVLTLLPILTGLLPHGTTALPSPRDGEVDEKCSSSSTRYC